MKKIFFLLALAYGSHAALAQSPPNGNPPSLATPRGNGRITGTVLDSTNRQPVPFATVALTDPATSKPVDGTVCDEKGKFTLIRVPAGSYTLTITFIGYQTVEKRSLVVADRGTNLNLGTLLIASQTKQLDVVTVSGQKALIEERVDRTVYNAENDQTTKGGDATDVLRRVPMLSVDLDGNVSMRGNQNIRVLINNRPSTISANSVADALRQIPADLIKTVEVITSPSAKYDAEGSAGIINIITKKNTLQGLTLNVDAGVGLRGSNLGLNGGYRKGKMGFSLGGGGRARYNSTGSFENRQLTNSGDTLLILNTQRADTRGNNLFGRYTLGWDYDIDPHNALTASVEYGVRNGNDFQDRLRTQGFRNGLLTSGSVRDVDVADLSGTVDVNLNYTHTFEKPQQEFSLLTLFSRNNRTNDFVNNILQDGDYSTLSRLKNLNESANQETTVQADYQTPIGKTQLFEIGGKNIARRVTSDYEYLFAEGSNGPFLPDRNRQAGNVFNYDQNVTAGYSSYTLNFLKTYSLKAGARYEYTTIDARFQDNQSVTIPSYGVLVPSFNVSKRLKNGNSVKAAYNRRIQRPSLQFLNPNLQAANPLNASVGNPGLRPEFTNNYELSLNTNFKGTFLTFSTFVRNTNNAIQPVRNVLGQDTILTTYQNIGREDAYGLSVFANINLSNKLSLNGGGDAYYADLNNNVSDPLYNASNQGWVYSGRLFGSYKLSKGWGLQLFSFYRGRQVQLQGTQGGFGIYSLSVKKDINNKRGSFGVGAENFFSPKLRIRNELVSPVINQLSTTVRNRLSFRIDFSYRIGKLTVDNNAGRRRRKSVNNDDLKGGGGDDNQGGGGGGGQPAAPAGGPPGGAQPASGQPGQAPRPGQNAPRDSTRQGSVPGGGQFPRPRPASDSTQTVPGGSGSGERTDSTQHTLGQPPRPTSTPVAPADTIRPVPSQVPGSTPANRPRPDSTRPTPAPGTLPRQDPPKER